MSKRSFDTCSKEHEIKQGNAGTACRGAPISAPLSLFASARDGHMSACVQVFGRRHEEAIHALRRPASEKRQCTKSREVGTGGAASNDCAWQKQHIRQPLRD